MNIASLFNLAGPDLIIILLIVLLLFGAKKLPELAKGMGQAVREFTKAKDEFEREVTRPVAPTEEAGPEARSAENRRRAHDSTGHDSHDPHGDQTQEVPHTPETARRFLTPRLPFSKGLAFTGGPFLSPIPFAAGMESDTALSA